jgi:hypothetical protein
MEDKEYWENDMIKTLGLTREQWLGDEPVSPHKCESGYELDHNFYHNKDFNFWWHKGNKFAMTKDNKNIIFCSAVNIGNGCLVSANPFNKIIIIRSGSGEFDQNDVLNQDAVVKIKKVFEEKEKDPKCIIILKSILRREFNWD